MIGLIRDTARVTVELASPLAIGSGAWDDLVDSPFVLDANGLPTIPGTSTAGALRAAWARFVDEDEARRLFGYQDRGPDGTETGAASRVEISFAALHDSRDQPVGPRLDASRIEADELLRAAQTAVVRPHVRIDHRGVADAEGLGLYDRSQVAMGHRFTLEIVVLDEPPEALPSLLGLLGSGVIRLGARGRSGLGQLLLVRAQCRRFDLTDETDFDDYSRLPVDLSRTVPAGVLHDTSVAELGAAGEGLRRGPVAQLEVSPRSFWLFGGGSPEPGADKAPDMLPYREPRVAWADRPDSAGVLGRFLDATDDYPVPASSLKGALRHRMAYHANRLAGAWALDGSNPEELKERDGAKHPHVRALFGEALEHENGERAVGSAGRVWIDEIRVVPAGSTTIAHVALDRFTSGPIDGALYQERALWKSPADQPWKLKVWIEPPGHGGAEVPVEARRALELAIEDLVSGRLTVGAGYGRGNGHLEGSFTWSDGGAWIREESSNA